MIKPNIIDYLNEDGNLKYIEYLHQLSQYVEYLENELESEIEKSKQTDNDVWLKTHDILKLLDISEGTLQTLRIKKTIPYSKIGGILFYNKRKIMELLEINEVKTKN
jgi:hypothetical protein